MIALLLFACTSVPSDTDEADTDGFTEPVGFRLIGGFAYDPVQDGAVGYGISLAAMPLQPWLDVVVDVEKADGELDSCSIGFSHDPELGAVPRAAWATDGFAIDTALSSFGGGCRNWDPEVWGNNPAETVANRDWGFGLGPLEDGVAAELQLQADVDDEMWALHWGSNVIGGQFRVDGEPLPGGFVFGYEVDEQFQIKALPPDDAGLHEVVADAIPIEATDIADLSAPPRGAYLVQSVEIYEAGLLQP